MKRLSAILAFLSLAMFGCSSDSVNNASNTANTVNGNIVNTSIENVSNVNGAVNRIISPESHAPASNTANQTRSNTNVRTKNKLKTDSLVDDSDKKADEIINNQNGAVKKLKKNVDKLIKDLP